MALKFDKKILITLLALCLASDASAMSNNNKADPFPVFTTLDPTEYLFNNTKTYLRDGGCRGYGKSERWSLSLSPYGQNADMGKNEVNDLIELGDLNGKFFMLGLTMGKKISCAPAPYGTSAFPAGKSFDCTLQNAMTTLYNPPPTNGLPLADNCSLVDPSQQFSFFTTSLNYRKRGIRAQFEWMAFANQCASTGLGRFMANVGLIFQGGICDICQDVEAFKDLTQGTSPLKTSTIFPKVTPDNVKQALMTQLQCIADEQGFDIDNFHRTSPEDTRIGLFWRDGWLINPKSKEFPEFIVMPYASIDLSIPTTKKNARNLVFAVPFGNNDSWAGGAKLGLNVDFTETVEIGAEAGVTVFSSLKLEKFPMPNSKLQQGLFPFQTDVRLKPGLNTNFAAKLQAYHFLENLSFYFQYVLVNHSEDRITLVDPNPNNLYQPDLIEDASPWRSQVANVAFNYDISRNISLGFLWQAPLSERSAYRSSTIMFSFSAIF